MSRDDIDTNYSTALREIQRNAPPPPDPERPNVIMESNRHIPIELLGIFHRCPERLLEEGFTEETLEHFGVGVDQVHSRITFPLRDLVGNLVGISGRAMLDSQKERYKVYKEEYTVWELPPYNTDKSHLLWNAHIIHPRALKAYELPTVVVEGFKGCMWVHQAGIPNVVSLMTKRMSTEQQWILKDMGGPFILFPDNDEAGIDGVVKVCKELSKISRHVKIVEYEATQPTDVPLEDIPELIESATDYLEMLV
jgi:DNA primase